MPLRIFLRFPLAITAVAILAFSAVAEAQQCQHDDWGAKRAIADNLGQVYSFTELQQLVTVYRLAVLNEVTPSDLLYGKSRYGRKEGWLPRWIEAIKAAGFTPLPDQTEFGEGNFDFAADLLAERVAALGAGHPYIRQWIANQNAILANPYRNKVIPSLTPYVFAPDDPASAFAADDYAYQQAAAQFYWDDLDTAIAAFRQMAADPHSRFRAIATYMVGRTAAHQKLPTDALAQAELIEATPDFRPVKYWARQLVAYVSWYSQNEAARRRFIENSIEALAIPAADATSDPTLADAFTTAFDDLPHFLQEYAPRRNDDDAFAADWWLGDEVLTPRLNAFREASSGSDFLDWLQTMTTVRPLQWNGWAAYFMADALSPAARHITDHAFERALSTHQVHWVAAALSRAIPSFIDGDSRLKAVVRLAEESIARNKDCSGTVADAVFRETLTMHLTRLMATGRRYGRSADDWIGKPMAAAEYVRFLAQIGRFDDAHSLAEKLFAATPADQYRMPLPSSWGLNALKVAMAPDLGGFLGSGPPSPLDSSKKFLIDLLPITALQQLAESPALSLPDRAAIARMAWLRAYLLHRNPEADRLAPILRQLNPSLASYIDSMAGFGLGDTRRHAATLMLLEQPGMNLWLSPRNLFNGQPRYDADQNGNLQAEAVSRLDLYDHNDDNWWCALDPGHAYDDFKQQTFIEPLHDYALEPEAVWRLRSYQPEGISFGDYLARNTPLTNLIDWEELGALSKIPAAPEYLSREAIDWAKNASWLETWWYGDRIAWALHLAVRATHYGCNRDGPHGGYSREAFQILHRDFDDTEAAKQTPYWYN